MNVAFIGLGNMGLPMAKNLLKAGFSVKGFDISAAAVDALVNAGGGLAHSVIDVVDGVDVVVTMLPTSEHVRSLYMGQDALFEKLKPGTLLIDCSTIRALSSKELSAAAAGHGMDMIDAPVSGGTIAAADGALTFMVGGANEQLERARPLLQAMGKKIMHAGSAGSGQLAKACNNMLLGIIMVGTSEALRLGMASGLDPNVLSDIIGNSSGASWMLGTNNPCPGTVATAPSARGYQGGFAVDLMLKDLNLALDASVDARTSTPLGAMARSLFALHSAAGHGGLDFGSIFNLFAPQAHSDVLA